MKIALIGYGKMGKEIEKIALERGHTISLKVTSQNADYTSSDLKSSDVAIEFSIPEAAKQNIYKCFEAHVPVAIGTTAWYKDFDEVVAKCESGNHAMLYASNFSLGVNLFWQMTEKLSSLMENHKEYTASINEIHHTEKLDSPSGTAITTAEKVLSNSSDLKNWFLSEHNKVESESLPITAERIPNVPGTHTVKYESEIDKIELTHEAKSRKGFALGSILAAEFLHKKQGVYTMNDLLGL